MLIQHLIESRDRKLAALEADKASDPPQARQYEGTVPSYVGKHTQLESELWVDEKQGRKGEMEVGVGVDHAPQLPSYGEAMKQI